MKEITELFDYLAQHGGEIVCTSSLSTYDIEQARASGRMFVREDSLGFVWMPPSDIPTTEEAVENFDKWFPLEYPLPPEIDNPDFLFKKFKKKQQISEKLLFQLLKEHFEKNPPQSDSDLSSEQPHKDLLSTIQQKQIIVGEQAVIANLKKKGLI